MSFVAFLDMVGTRASAMMSNDEYTASINDFTDAMKQLSEIFNCRIYGYSDNAYIEFSDHIQMIQFFRLLRENLLYQHRYFTAAVSLGSLQAKQIYFGKPKGFAMKFTSAVATDIYISQRQFSGIGVSLSNRVVQELHSQQMDDQVCKSIYHRCSNSGDDMGFEEVIDLAYAPVSLEQLRYIFADYIMAAAMSVRAGRYYLTPIISMLKCLDPSVLSENLSDLVDLLSFQTIPPAFQSLKYNSTYSLFFILALVDRVISLREKNPTIDATKICEYIVGRFINQEFKFITALPSILEAVISCSHKREFLRIIYNMRKDSNIMGNSIDEKSR